MAAAIQQFMKTQKGRDAGQIKIEKFVSSKLKEETMVEQIVVIVDARELGALVTRELAKLGAYLKSETLEVGDFILSDRVVVERKDVDDFASSIIDGRLFEQAGRLRDSFTKPIIVVEGERLTGSGRVRPEAMMGAYASILVDYGITIVWTREPSETAQLMFAIARREQVQEKRPIRIMTAPKPSTTEHQQEFIVSSLPNIDSTRAKKLLDHFQTVERIFLAQKEELMSVSGIGERISEEIRHVLTIRYKTKAEV
jgi:Fanconi anemia group M protein